ncbi:hypothetical protein LCGC14_2268460, partial [marine sediment metagenome]
CLLTRKSEEFIELIRKELPEVLEIESKDILEFLQKCKPKSVNADFTASIKGKQKKINPCPEEWEKLVSSLEDKYQNGREQLLKGERRKLGEYLVSEDYEPWPNTITWHLLGLPQRGIETRGVTGLATGMYRRWGFIRPENPFDEYKKNIMVGHMSPRPNMIFCMPRWMQTK